MFAVDSFVTPGSMTSQRFLVTRLNIPVVLLPAILYSLHIATVYFPMYGDNIPKQPHYDSNGVLYRI